MVRRYQTIFCSATCFEQAWPRHREFHVGSQAAGGDGDRWGGGELSKGAAGGNGGDAVCKPVPADEPWTEVGFEPCFTPGADEVGCVLRVEVLAVHASDPDGPPLFEPKWIVTEPALDMPPLPPRRGIVTAGHGASGSGVRFRVLTYNILAEIYATQQMYPYCDPWALKFAYRIELIVRELIDAAADVICLQEVQRDAFEGVLMPRLGAAGYAGLYKQKTREDMGVAGKVDGCALFWRKAKFRLSEHYEVEFNEGVWSAMRAARRMSEGEEREILSRMLKDNVAQLAVLQVVSPDPRGGAPCICVANTHLYSNPSAPDVKLWQCLALVNEVENLVNAPPPARPLPVMLCGDFNSSPDSAVYELLASRQLSASHPELNHPSAHQLSALLPNLLDEGGLRHSLALESAYGAVMGQEPPYTNFTAQARSRARASRALDRLSLSRSSSLSFFSRARSSRACWTTCGSAHRTCGRSPCHRSPSSWRGAWDFRTSSTRPTTSSCART